MSQQNRIILGNEAVFMGNSPATGTQSTGSFVQLHRIKTFSYKASRPMENVMQAGDLAPIDRLQMQAPSVDFNCSYLVTNTRNESGLGLNVGGAVNCIAPLLTGANDADRNIFIRIVPQGFSANGYTPTDGGVHALGNMNLASYQTEGRVGSFPTAEFTSQGMNVAYFSSAASIDTPAIDPVTGLPIVATLTIPTATSGQASQPTALRPGDITVNLTGSAGPGSLLGLNNISIQSYQIGFDLNLKPQISLGSHFPTSRDIEYPVECRMSVELMPRDVGTGNLANLRCNETKYDLSVILKKTNCTTGVGDVAVSYTLKQASFDGIDWSNPENGEQTATLNFLAQIGSATQTDKGMFISGSLS